MPQVTIRTGSFAPDGREEALIEYVCDWPDCPNIATEVVGCAREVGLSTVMCNAHAVASRVRSTVRRNGSTSA